MDYDLDLYVGFAMLATFVVLSGVLGFYIGLSKGRQHLD